MNYPGAFPLPWLIEHADHPLLDTIIELEKESNHHG